jgi:hypothetical protein
VSAAAVPQPPTPELLAVLSPVQREAAWAWFHIAAGTAAAVAGPPVAGNGTRKVGA